MYCDEGNGTLFLRLGLFYQLSDLAGYWGRWMLSLSLGLYYLLAGLCRILGEMYAVLLVWVYTTSFQTLLDTGGDVCRLLVWAF